MARDTVDSGARIPEGGLSGSTILLTGGSGFLGKTVLATLLARAARLERLIVLLRADDDDAAERRLTEMLADEPFSGLPEGQVRERLGSGRLAAIAGHLDADSLGERLRGRLGTVDTVIHCAASVSFEEALDDALELNAFGPARLLDSLRADGADPHFVHVSTAFAADCRVGIVAEDGAGHPALDGFDPAAMVEEARRWRAAAEAAAAEPSRRRELHRAAARDAAHRHGMDVEERAEQLRQRWLVQRLAAEGRRFAVSVGWPDTYALSKAVAERLVAERARRVTILRPSIIESALRQPFPGWLAGIKVADPLILAYAARGLTDLPGRAENRIDIVPVDLVANACVAAAAFPPEDGVRTVAIVSTCRNPLTLGELAAHTRAHFRREPLRRDNGKPIAIGDLRFVEQRIAVRRSLRRQRLLEAAARAGALAPGNSVERTLRRGSALAARVTRMVEIYGPYTELDCVFDDSNARALERSLPPVARELLPFDSAAIDWTSYLQGTHLPRIQKMTERPAAAQLRGGVMISPAGSGRTAVGLASRNPTPSGRGRSRPP